MRQHDGEENVRFEVVKAIVATAKLDFSVVSESEDLLNYVKERTLDKKVGPLMETSPFPLDLPPDLRLDSLSSRSGERPSRDSPSSTRSTSRRSTCRRRRGWL
jgi:hypothetical protein